MLKSNCSFFQSFYFTLKSSSVICLRQYMLSLDYFIFYNNCDITFLTVFILTHPVNFPCGRKPEYPEKTNDFRQSVDRLFPNESVARIEPRISDVKGTCSDDCLRNDMVIYGRWVTIFWQMTIVPPTLRFCNLVDIYFFVFRTLYSFDFLDERHCLSCHRNGSNIVGSFGLRWSW